MPNIIKYQYQVPTGRQYAGPTPLQIASLFEGTQQKIRLAQETTRVLTGEARKVVGALLNQHFRLQQAYENSQLSKAKAGYFATMKKFAQELPYSGIPVEEWQNEYYGKAQEIMGEAMEMLQPAARQYLVGPKQQATILDEFDAWRIEQDAAFGSLVFQNQRAKMTDELKETIQLGLSMVRKDPEYLQNFISDIQRNIEATVISGEYGSTLIEQAKQIAGISALYDYAQGLGIQQGATFLANDDNLVNVPADILPEGVDFLSLDYDARNRLRRDFDIWTGQIQSDAEAAGSKMVEQARRHLTEMFYTGIDMADAEGNVTRQWLTMDYLRKYAPLFNDPNSPQANSDRNTVYGQFNNMLLQRFEAARSGGKDPNDMDNEALKNKIIFDINDPLHPKEDTWDEIQDNIGADADGNPRLSGDTAKSLHDMNERKKLSLSLGLAKSKIMASAGPGKILTVGEAGKALDELTTTIHQRWVASQDPQTGVDAMSEEEISQWADNIIEEAVHLQFENVWGGAKKIPEEIQRKHNIWLEATEVDWYKKYGRGRRKGSRVVNLDALVTMIQEGDLYGLAYSPEWRPRLEAAKEVFDGSFKDWTGIDPAGLQVEVMPEGHIVYYLRRNLVAEGLGEGMIKSYYTPYYDESADKLTWARYDPYTGDVIPLMDKTKEQVPFYQVRDYEFSQWQLSRGQPERPERPD